jgi:hypothetical protein
MAIAEISFAQPASTEIEDINRRMVDYNPNARLIESNGSFHQQLSGLILF